MVHSLEVVLSLVQIFGGGPRQPDDLLVIIACLRICILRCLATRSLRKSRSQPGTTVQHGGAPLRMPPQKSYMGQGGQGMHVASALLDCGCAAVVYRKCSSKQVNVLEKV